MTLTVDSSKLDAETATLEKIVGLLEISIPRVIRMMTNGFASLAPCMVRCSSKSGSVNVSLGKVVYVQISFDSSRKLTFHDMRAIVELWGHGRVNLQRQKKGLDL